MNFENFILNPHYTKLSETEDILLISNPTPPTTNTPDNLVNVQLTKYSPLSFLPTLRSSL